jgi:hypothetical protein
MLYLFVLLILAILATTHARLVLTLSEGHVSCVSVPQSCSAMLTMIRSERTIVPWQQLETSGMVVMDGLSVS